ncbi:MAG: hypothetical protein ACSLFI_03980 [Solirubrobacterales bacterium]
MDHEAPRKLRPTQIAVIVVTAFLMALMSLSFGFGLYTVIHPGEDADGSNALGELFGISLMLFAILPAIGVWGMWMLWNDLARRKPGSALKWTKKP